MAETFIMRKEWLDNIKNQPVEVQDMILGDMFRYAAGEPLEHEDDKNVFTVVNFVKGRIDNTTLNYEKSVAQGKMGGRPKASDAVIFDLAAEGLDARAIAEKVNLKYDTIRRKEEYKSGHNEFIRRQAAQLGF